MTINEAAAKFAKKEEVSILRSIAKEAIDKAKKKFPKYNIGKYFKVITNAENKGLFIEGDEPLNLINVISPAEFVEEYNFDGWAEYNVPYNFIFDYVRNQANKNHLSGEVGADLEKDGGIIWYQED